jgi:hypothetical protein
MTNESIKIAEAYSRIGDWERTQQYVLENDILQKGKEVTTKRVFRELKKRLEKLSPEQINLLLEENPANQRLVLLQGICKLYRFIGEFVIEVLRNKVLTFEQVILDSDYDRFFQMKAANHPELEELTENTKKKLRSRILRILTETGLINNVKDKWINPPLITAHLAGPVIQESPELLKFWLVSDKDIDRLIKQYHHA